MYTLIKAYSEHHTLIDLILLVILCSCAFIKDYSAQINISSAFSLADAYNRVDLFPYKDHFSENFPEQVIYFTHIWVWHWVWYLFIISFCVILMQRIVTRAIAEKSQHNNV